MLLFLEQLKSFIEANLSKPDLNVRMLEKEMGINRYNPDANWKELGPMTTIENMDNSQ